MAGHSARVRGDIARWVEQGFIDVATADVLARDIEQNERRSLSFGLILAMMAALLFGAAILIFIAANWEAFPRIARVAVLFLIISGGYVGGAVLKSRDHPATAEALWVIAAAAFGGSIALIGQMYHMSGDEASALVTWGAGTAFAAFALRSNPLTVAAVGIADAWLIVSLVGSFDFFRFAHIPQFFVLAALSLYALSFWTRSQPARHLIILSLIFYVATLAVDHGVLPTSIMLVTISAAAFAAAIVAPTRIERVVHLGGRLPLHALVGFLTGMFIIQFELVDDRGFALAGAVTLAGIAAAIVLAGRESRGLRWLAYVAFAAELCLIYAVTMETMLGTAGFFLAAALILAVLAFVIIRVEKRMTQQPFKKGAAA